MNREEVTAVNIYDIELYVKKKKSIISIIKYKIVKLKIWALIKLIGDTPVIANLSLPIPIVLSDNINGIILKGIYASPSNTIVRTKWESEPK